MLELQRYTIKIHGSHISSLSFHLSQGKRLLQFDFGGGSGTGGGGFGGVGGACSACTQSLEKARECVMGEDSSCDVAACIGGGFDLSLESCCPDCAGAVSEAVMCLAASCFPDCLFESSFAYGVCLFQNMEECQQSCMDVAANSPGIDLGGAGGTIGGGIVGGIVGELPTCEDMEEAYESLACPVASCCEECIEEFDGVSNCMVNELIMPIFMMQGDGGDDGQAEQCNLSCASDIGVRRNRRRHRGLESGSGSNQDDIEDLLDKADVVEACRNQLAERMILATAGSSDSTTPVITGEAAANIGDAYVECIQAVTYEEKGAASTATSSNEKDTAAAEGATAAASGGAAAFSHAAGAFAGTLLAAAGFVLI